LSLIRRCALAAAGLAAIVLAAGCGSSAANSGNSDSGTISVVMAQYSDLTKPYWTDLVSRFEQQHPGIHVNLRVVDWNTLLQQVPTMVQTRSYPDVLNFNAYSTFAQSGLLRPASDVLSPDVLANFQSSFVSSDSIQGTQYGIPWIASVRALGYNKDVFQHIGITTPPATWADLAADAQKAKQAGYVGYCLPMGAEESQAEWSLWMWSGGGGWVSGNQWTINSPKNLTTLNFLRTLANTDQVTEPDPGKTNRTDGCWADFAQGRVAMTEVMPLGTFQTSTMKGSSVHWGSAPWPRTATSVPQFTLGVQDVMMAFNKPNNAGPVRTFLDFVYSDSQYLKFVRGEGFLPTTKSASQAMTSDPVAGPGIALLPKARFYPTTNSAWNKVQTAVQSELGTALEPSTDPKSVLDSLQQTAQSG
jgi:multiple sugar transport system substrate-binding protein